MSSSMSETADGVSAARCFRTDEVVPIASRGGSQRVRARVIHHGPMTKIIRFCKWAKICALITERKGASMKRDDLEKMTRLTPAQVTAKIKNNLLAMQVQIESAMSIEYWTGYYAALAAAESVSQPD